MGKVVKCSNYEAKDLPYLLSKEAWLLKKDDKGFYFEKPGGEIARVNEGGRIGFTKRVNKDEVEVPVGGGDWK